MKHEFPAPRPVEAYVELRSGDLTVTATATDQVVIEITGGRADSVVVEAADDRISVVEPRRSGFLAGRGDLHVSLVVPELSGLASKLGSSSVRATGQLGAVRISSGAGNIELGSVADNAVIKTGSGNISVEALGAESEVKSGAGRITVGNVLASTQLKTGAGPIHVARAEAPVVLKSGSGDLSVDSATDDTTLSAASGDIRVRTMHSGQANLKNVSGDIRLGVPAGTPVWTDVTTSTGLIRSTLVPAGAPAAGQDHVEVRARSATGDIYLEGLEGLDTDHAERPSA
jgi:Putative adhesin